MTGNISKEKRDKLLSKIADIKEFMQNNNADPSFLGYLNELQNEISSKKYGLVYEEHREEIDEILDNYEPVFEEQEKYIIPSGKVNFLLEGDNLAALKLLEKTHKNAIDFIYIDPPYNTSNGEFVYNDKRIDGNDQFKHSKWLSFMCKRLEMAKMLLKPHGIICLSIGDDEQANLKLLCNDVFGEDNCIGCIARLAKAGGNKGDLLKPKKDYVLVYAKEKDKIDKRNFGKEIKTKEYNWEKEIFKGKERYFCIGEMPYRRKLDSRPNQRYYIECPDGSYIIPPGNVFPDSVYDGAFVKPVDNQDKCWTWSVDRYLEEKKQNRFYFYKVKTPIFLDQNAKPSFWGIRKKIFKTEAENTITKEVLTDFISDFQNGTGTKELDSLDIDFSYPKPTSLISYLTEICAEKNSIILDFFAGSGTTAQAVMQLNKEDGGNRTFILCTNNENDICEKVTFERIKRVIEKEKYQEGLKYFKIDYVDKKDKVYYEYADELINHITELVELENAIDFRNNKTIVIALTDEKLDEILSNEKTLNDIKKIYLGHDILMSQEQAMILNKNNIEFVVIPNYYYSDK